MLCFEIQGFVEIIVGEIVVKSPNKHAGSWYEKKGVRLRPTLGGVLQSVHELRIWNYRAVTQSDS